MRLLGKALTFDDVLLVPAFSQVLPRDTSLATQFTRNIRLNLPLVSAAMDTVTESRLAIAIAQEGGIGIIHKNLTPKQQAAEVARVKRYESGVLRDPITISSGVKVRDVIELSKQHGISGFPVVDDGKVVGIVTGRDLRFETRLDVPVREIMTPRERLIVVEEGSAPAEAKALMHQHKLERVVVVNAANELRGLVTVKDINKQTNFPNAARDPQGKLRVGAAVGVGSSLAVAWVQSGGDFVFLVWVSLVFVVGQLLESFVLTPTLIGDRIGLHPVAVIFVLMGGAQLAGFVGILLALPVAAVVWVFCRHGLQHYRQSNTYQGD